MKTVPDNKNSAIKFGIAIRPLKVSAIFHTSPRSIVAPIIATREYTIIKGLMTFAEKINSMQRAPYNPHPIIVENAKQHMETAVNIDTQFPYVDVNPRIVSSAPAASPYAIGTPLQRITSAVSVQMTMVSVNTSNTPKKPCLTGF